MPAIGSIFVTSSIPFKDGLYRIVGAYSHQAFLLQITCKAYRIESGLATSKGTLKYNNRYSDLAAAAMRLQWLRQSY